ncbi:six-cysteine ranthipeptide SCIFF [uncultured Parvimonas sp.]
MVEGGCGECQTSSKTSSGVANQPCEKCR